jgi:hypothetical protein
MSFTERDLEDYVCEHPREAFGTTAEILGRQVRLPNGVLDVLAWDHYDGSIIVAELKARPLAGADVGQVARYAGDVGDILRWVGSRWVKPGSEAPAAISRFYHYFAMGQTDSSETCAIVPTLIGASITDKVLASIIGARGQAITWHREKGQLTFTPALPFGMARPHWDKDGWLRRLLVRIYDECGIEASHHDDPVKRTA